MSNLSLRQIINNHPLAQKVNNSSLGKKFQNSEFAKQIEAEIILFNSGVSDSIASGSGFIESLIEGIETLFSNNYQREHIVNYSIAAERPDLSGKLDPRQYDDALRLQSYGWTNDDVLKKLGHR